MLRYFVLFLIALNALTTHAEVVSGDKPYFLVEDGGYQFILSEEHRYVLTELVYFNRFFLKEYQRSFSWKFDEKASLILASMQNQITNGYATPIPNLMTVFYPTAGDFMDEAAFSSWINMLLAHETSHLYQLDTKQGFAKDLHPVVGNPIVFMTPWVVPVFIAPNILMPTFMLEGNAVFNESRFGLGGRLFSGEYRALVFALAKSGQITAKRLFNDHLYFPFGKEKYLVGGYFFNHVNDKLSADRTNSIYLDHGNHFFNPLLLEGSFERSYGGTYDMWIDSFKKDIEEKAASQQKSSENALLAGYSWGGFNQDRDTVFGLFQQDMITPPWFVRIRKADGQIVEKKRMDIPEGKMFWLDNRWWSVSSQQLSPTKIEYGLYREGFYPSKQFRSEVVQDLRGGHTLTVDAVKSFSENKFLLDGKPFVSSSSSGILDESGHVYYFKQQRKTRTLYRDDTPLTSYQGYYGKVLEADDKGQVFFIASTDTGSSLFVYSKGKIQRLSPSDTITDARVLSAQSAAVIEVGARGIELKVIALQPKDEIPEEYIYKFEAAPQAMTYSDLYQQQFPQPDLKEKQYSPLWELRKSTFEPSIGFYENQLLGGFSANFVDPLLQNSLTMAYARTVDFNNQALVQYTNSARRLNWYIGGYHFGKTHYAKEKVVGRSYDNLGFVGLLYPFLRRGHWSLNSMFETSYVNDDDKFRVKPENTMDSYVALTAQYLQSYPLSFGPYRQYTLGISYGSSNNTDKSLAKVHDAFGVKAGATYDIYKENIVSVNAGAGFSPNSAVEITDAGSLKTQPYNFTSLVPGYSANAREIKNAGLTYKKVFQTPLYFVQIPLGLRRMAPFARVQYFKLKQVGNNEYHNNFTQWEYGVEVEFLLAHRFPIPISISEVKDNRNLTPGGLYLRTSTQWNF